MFMDRVKIAPEYSEDYLEIERPSPLSDNVIESLITDVMSGKIDKDISDKVYDDFKKEAEEWILGSALNNLKGLETFAKKDIIIGCTQFIDTLYMKGDVQVLKHDYKYHERLNNKNIIDHYSHLLANTPLILANPFPSTGAVHKDINNILSTALDRNCPVHIDGAWITCCKDINFDFNHPAIKSVGISLSKGLGLGWNRIGLRWSKETDNDAISIMNDFRMNNRALAIIGLHFIRNLPTDYLWTKHRDQYYKVCKDFNLEPTNSIYLALKNNNPVGISPLIRYLDES